MNVNVIFWLLVTFAHSNDKEKRENTRLSFQFNFKNTILKMIILLDKNCRDSSSELLDYFISQILCLGLPINAYNNNQFSKN